MSSICKNDIRTVVATESLTPRTEFSILVAALVADDALTNTNPRSGGEGFKNGG